MEEMNIPYYDIVYNAILSTKIGTTEFRNPVEKVLHDLDWSGFSMSYEDMIENENKIFYEATYDGSYSQRDVKRNQLAFYESIINKNLYVTNTYSKMHSEIAKENIEKRIKCLKLTF